MKKLSLSLMLNVSLALMLALSLIYPQSVAVSFVAAWAILATVICVVAGGVGVYATEYVLERYGRELPPESLAVKIVASLFFAAGAVAQTGGGSGGDGGDVYLAGRCRVDFLLR
ncbi:LysA protein [Escherichia coli]|uniref:LysA protein n=1 Tax=Escherichia coli TaxID=562 RepID=A0A2X1JZY6_ECOLX|nr:LysA protein [Escherichia coli]